MIIVEEDRFTYDGSSDVLISDFKVACKNLLCLLPSISKLDFYEAVEFLFIELLKFLILPMIVLNINIIFYICTIKVLPSI